MKTGTQIREYISSLPEKKRQEMEALHTLILGLTPGGKRWFLDGRKWEKPL